MVSCGRQSNQTPTPLYSQLQQFTLITQIDSWIGQPLWSPLLTMNFYRITGLIFTFATFVYLARKLLIYRILHRKIRSQRLKETVLTDEQKHQIRQQQASLSELLQQEVITHREYEELSSRIIAREDSAEN